MQKKWRLGWALAGALGIIGACTDEQTAPIRSRGR